MVHYTLKAVFLSPLPHIKEYHTGIEIRLTPFDPHCMLAFGHKAILDHAYGMVIHGYIHKRSQISSYQGITVNIDQPLHLLGDHIFNKHLEIRHLILTKAHIGCKTALLRFFLKSFGIKQDEFSAVMLCGLFKL